MNRCTTNPTHYLFHPIVTLTISFNFNYAQSQTSITFEMWGITTDVATGKYVLTENGVTYYMTLEHTRLLKQYFRSSDMKNPTIGQWYKDLDRFTRKEITVVGQIGKSETDFYPDISYE